jgi:HEPN domain-containing protein
MKKRTADWIEKAEGDFHTAEREWRVRKNRNFDAICFHVQQCVEKYMKGRMQEEDVRFPKIHDLSKLLDICVKFEPLWEPFRNSLVPLTNYAVIYRYPGFRCSKADAKSAIQTCRSLRKSFRISLSLKAK